MSTCNSVFVISLRRHLFFFLIASMLPLAEVCASQPKDRSVEEVYHSSKLVVRARILSVRDSCGDSGCGPARYTAEISDIEKNIFDQKIAVGSTVTFCAREPLSTGNDFFLFLSEVSPLPSRGFSGFTTANLRGKECKLIASHDGLFFPVDEDIFKVWSQEAYTVLTHKDEMLKTNNTYFTFGIKISDFQARLQKARSSSGMQHPKK